VRFHGRLLDPSFAPHFFVFKRRVIAIYNSGVRCYDHWDGNDQFTVQMRIDNDDVYVMLIGKGSGFFQFFTSGMPVHFVDPSYLLNVIGVEISSGLKLQSHAVMLDEGAKVEQGMNVGPMYVPHQVQLLDEPNACPGPASGSNYPRLMYESFAPMTSHTGCYRRAYACGSLLYHQRIYPVSTVSHQTRDVFYDMSWGDSKGRNRVRVAILEDPADWPRSNGIQKVKSTEWGEREFAIYVDAFDQVSVFPTGSITPFDGEFNPTPTQNIDPSLVQMQRATLPAWAYAKTVRFKDYFPAPDPDDPVGTGIEQFPDIDWKLHPDGTHMCAVVHERVEAAFDAAFFAPYAVDIGTQGPGAYYPTADSFWLANKEMMGLLPMAQAFSDSTAITDKWFHVATGIIEIEIKITITGPQLTQFTLELTTREVRRPTTSEYSTFVAGYTYHNVRGPKKEDGTIPIDAHRGDMCVLDIECYGGVDTGHTASLYSLKNLTTNKEIRTFNAISSHVDNVAIEGHPLNTAAPLIAYNMQTLSFVTKDQVIFSNDLGVDYLSNPISDSVTHFGLTVRVMGDYKTTMFPDSIDDTAKQMILTAAKTFDARAYMLNAFNDMAFMPLNDLRGWGDPDLDSLREEYCRSFSHTTYTPPIDPQFNWANIQTFGAKYYKTGARDFPVPTAAASMWYHNLMNRGIRPFAMFDLTEPRPGWMLYAFETMKSLFSSPYTTFYSHPNGTWALFEQSFIYNRNPLISAHNDPTTAKIIQSALGDFDVLKVEHCIFDRIHFSLPTGLGTTGTKDTSFLAQYNEAVVRQTLGEGITDDTRALKKDYSDMRVAFSLDTIADPYDPTVEYLNLRADWYDGYTVWMRETGVFSGQKDFGVGFDSRSAGSLSATSFATLWETSLASLEEPMFAHNHKVTFSTCVFVTP